MKYFVMLNKWNGHYGLPVPMTDDDDDTILFDTEEAANEAGETNLLGEAYGFEVYPWSLFEDE